MRMEDKLTNCPVSPKNKHVGINADQNQIFVNKFEASTLTSTNNDRNYYYNRLSQFRFPNDASCMTTSSSKTSEQDTLLGSPFKPTPTLNTDKYIGPSSPQGDECSTSSNKYSPSTPRYTPSPSFQFQCTTPTNSQGRLSHKRSIAVSISSSSMESIFSDAAFKSSIPDYDTSSSRTSADTCSSSDPQMYGRKLDFSGNTATQGNQTTCYRAKYHPYHSTALPLPLIDLDVAAEDPKPRRSSTPYSPLKKQYQVPNPFWENAILEDETGEEPTSSSEYDTSGTEPEEEFKDNAILDSFDPEYEPQLKGDSDEYIDLVDFLKESTVKETMAECEMTTKSRMESIHEDNYNPFQYIQLEESQWLYSPLCTPTVSRQSFD